MPSFYLQTPATRAAEWAHVASLLYTQHPEGGNFIWDVTEGQSIDVARNIICKKYLSHPMKPEFLLLADSDATWHPGAAVRLMSRNLPVVTGMIFKRGLPPVPTIGPHVGKTVNDDDMYSFGVTIEAILKRVEDEVDEECPNALLLPERDDDLIGGKGWGSGCHFMMVRRDVIEAIPYPWFEAVSESAGEDFNFCRKVEKAGFTLHADLSVYTGHIVGPKIDFGLREFLAFYKYTNKIKATEEVWKIGAKR